jgi:hypothetical protein
MQSAETVLDVIRDHWRAVCGESSPARFGKGPTEKDPNHGHLAGGLLHSVGAGGVKLPPATRLVTGYQRVMSAADM